MIIGTEPFTCPHGAYQARGERQVITIYSDGCRTTGGGTLFRFWCGENEMSKPNGVSITAGEYLRDWSEAEGINLDAVYRHWLKESKAREDAANLEAAHTEALNLNEGDDLYDEAENIDYHRTVEANDHAEYQQLMGAYESSAVQNAIKEHADYLGEVPWSDRVDD